MRVLVGQFSSESNEHSRSLMTFEKFLFRFGEEMLDSIYCRDIFEDVAKIADIDLRQETFWKECLQSIVDQMDEFLQLAKGE